MSREIKFRAWVSQGKMQYNVSPWQWDFCIDTTFFLCIKSGDDAKWEIGGHRYAGEVEKCLMQFTGLLDKNGKEIYEGDIIDYGSGRHYPITYEVNGFGIKFHHGHERNWLDLSKFEIIGNIHENPDLLTP